MLASAASLRGLMATADHSGLIGRFGLMRCAAVGSGMQCNDECSPRRSARGLGVWPAATCETHELHGVWDGNVTLSAWSVAEVAQ